ncbi:MAG: rod shape-determining protein [Acidimicrobiia bacterium]|nr:rod shape-determining protein [Acidimicrobiia bacterium]
MIGLRARSSAPDLAIDLGTANVRLATARSGLVLDQPSLVARDGRGSLVAAGHEAVHLARHSPSGLSFTAPLAGGVVVDLDAAVALVHWALRQVAATGRRRPHAVASVPVGATEVERRALETAIVSAGTRSPLTVVEEPLSAAIGAGLAVADPYGSMVLDVGAGITEAAVVAEGGVVASSSARVGCRAVAGLVARHMSRRHGLTLRPGAAQRIWPRTLAPGAGGGLTVEGCDVRSGQFRALEVGCEELAAVVQTPLHAMATVAREALERAPIDLAADVAGQGLALVGGGARVPGLGAHLSAGTALPVRVPPDPLHAVATGSAACLRQVAVLPRP